MRSLVACFLVLVTGCANSFESGQEEASGGSAGDGDGGSETSLGGELNSSGGETNGVGGETVTESGGADSSGGETSTGGGDGSGGSAEPSGGSSSGGASSGGASSGGSGSGGSPPVDSDGDGVPDSIDQCPGGDDLQDLNENGEIDECEPGWCHKDGDPEKSLCSVGYGVRQGYCTMEEYSPQIGPGECVQCTTYNYDCNDDWSDGCETWSTGAHPCFPDGL